MKTKNVLKAVLVAVVSFGIVFGSVPKSVYAEEIEAVKYTLDSLNSNSLWNWQVKIGEHTGLPSALYGSLTNQYQEEPQDVSRRFLFEYPEITGMGNSSIDYRMADTINMAGTYILYVQMYNGIPIEQSYLLFSVTRDHRVSLVKSKIFNYPEINTNPQLGDAEAYNIALADALKDVYVEEPGDTELVILPSQDTASLAWRVHFRTDDFGGELIYLIDDNGVIVEKIQKQDNEGENLLINKDDVLKIFNSLDNPDVLNESKGLVGILSRIAPQDDYREIIAEAIITADLNVTGGQNLPQITETLKNSNFSPVENLAEIIAQEPPMFELTPEQEQVVKETIDLEPKDLLSLPNPIKEPDQIQPDLLPPPLVETVKETELIEQPKDESPVELLPPPLAENTQEPEKSETLEIGIFIEPQITEDNEAVLAYNALVAEITSGPKAVTYIVQPGDTASNIALYYGVDVGSVSAGQELNFSVGGVMGPDTLEHALADLNNAGAIVSQAQSEVQSASPDLLGLYMIKLNSAQLNYASLLIHVDALYDQLSNSTASAHDTSVSVIQNVDNGDSTTSTSTDQSSSTTDPAYYGHEPYPQTTQTSDTTTGDISDFLDDPSPSSSSDGAAATGGISGYNSDGAAATGSITASNTDDGAGATGTLTGYYMPPSGYTTTTSSSTSTQGSGATGGISGYDYTPGSNLIAGSETFDGSGGSSGGGGPATGSISG